ncbi:MAG: filamentous hemagglutinin N-terminal domain-containing protein [Candidatus Nitrohelix vancouverensis]|uniref:Filamentous hemagglutinin N-terminal domain-containing protein n=1 Tax=Candidatus Nitrohelix vancouverensis TaxID=2705534 RepID=A0A7T0C1G3_9BACT|nr:MAG: filamentous hemagglutinin N-terminal domain-containing protein [Candidatus Nitrohelix vancouverensis]
MNLMRQGEQILRSNPALAGLPTPPLAPKAPKRRATSSTGRRGQVFQRLRRIRGLHEFVSFLVLSLSLFPSVSFALPTDPQVQAGSASVNQDTATQMTVSQSSQKAIIDWGSFNIGTSEHVDFQLSHGANGVTLNRVIGDDPSSILGKLTSNGMFMLINRNGIMFGKDAQIDVHSLVATTNDINNSDFLSGNYNFSIAPDIAATVVNRGTLSVAQGGLAALVAPGVINEGVINARLGRVSLAGANTFTLDLYGDQLVNLGIGSEVAQSVFGVDGAKLDSLVKNSGSILAEGGIVRMDVAAAQGIVDNVINMSGIVQAQSATQQNGKIILSGGDNGIVSVSGTLDASGRDSGETGGDVHILGQYVALMSGTLVDVSGDLGGGTILAGGDYQGQGTVPNAIDTYVDANAQFFADALTNGDGGRAIFWADRRNYFFGRVSARGGLLGGDGGFVEVSGKEELYFDGSVDLMADNGKTGTLLLDPASIIIADGSASSGTSGTVTFGVSGNSFSITGFTSGSQTTIFETTLEAISATTNIILTADNTITINDLSDNTLSLAQTSGNSVSFITTTGNISFADTSDTLQTQGGSIELTAGDGTLTLGGLTSNNGSIILKSKDIDVQGSINSGTATTTILAHISGSNATIGLGDASGNTMTISGTELGRISAGNLVIGDSLAGNITVDNVTAANSNNITGTVTLNANADNSSVTFSGTASTFNALTVNADDGIAVNVALTTDTGALTLDGDSDNAADSSDNISIASGLTITSAGSITLDATTGGIAPAGAVTVNAANGVTVNDNFTSGGTVTIDADTDNSGTGTFTLASSKTLSSANNALSITADDMAINGSITSGSANLSLLVSDGGTIGLGSSSAGLNLSNTELQNLTAATLIIGDSTAGAITVASDVTPGASAGTGVTLLHLKSGVGVTATAGGIIEDNLVISTAGDVTFSDTSTNVTNLAMDLSNGNIAFTEADGFTVTTLDSVTGIDTDSGSVSLTATTGTLTVGNAIEASSNISLTADKMAIGASVTASGQTVTLASSTASNAIDLGSGTDAAANTLELSSSELNQITATNLVVGSTSAGAATISADITPSNATNLHIKSGSTVTGTAGGVIATGLAVTAAGDVTINDANTSISNLAMDLSTGNVVFSQANGYSVTTVDSVTGIDTDSGTVGLTSTGGTLTVANTAASNDIEASSNITLTADKMAIGGAVAASGQTVTLVSNTASNAIDLGSTTDAAANTLELSSAELALITATNLVVGTTSAGAATISADVTPSNATNLHLRTGSTVTGTAGGVIATGLAIEAGSTVAISDASTDVDNLAISAAGQTVSFTDADGVDINTVNGVAGVTATTFNLTTGGAITDTTASTISGTTTLAAGSANDITLDLSTNNFGTVVVSSGNNVSLRDADAITLGASTISGTLGLTAGTDVTIAGNVTTAGATTIDADSDDNGSGDLTVNASTTLSTTNNTLSITANDLILSGNINTGSAATTILVSDSGTIGLGTTGNLAISSAELANITATGLTLGNTSGGAITVGDGSNTISAANSDNIAGTLTLNSGGTVTFANSTTFNALAVNATGAITVNGGMTIDTGALSLASAAGITINSDSSLTGTGSVTFDADSDNNGSGDFTLASGQTFTTGNNTLSITANDIILNSSSAINAGTGSASILVSDAGTIGLGGTAGDLTLDGGELQLITAGTLTLGDSTNGNITVNGISSANSTKIGTMTLVADKAGSAINFATAASTFKGLTITNGTGGISFAQNVTANGNLSVTSGAAITDTGTLTATGTASFTTNVADAAITLDNTSNSFTGATTFATTGSSGNVTVNTDSALTLGASTVGGTMIVDVGGGNSLNVTGAVTSGGAMTLSADDDAIFTAAADLTSVGLTVTADSDATSDAGSGGAITLVDGTVFDAGSGTIALSADENISLGKLITTNATTSAVTLTSSSGGVFDVNTTALNIQAPSGRLTANTVTGFGATLNPIEIQVDSVSITNSSSGNIEIFESDDLNIINVTQSFASALNSGEGNITISYNGSITGQANATVPSGSFGLVSFNQRKIQDASLLPFGTTGKTVGDVAIEETVHAANSAGVQFSSNLSGLSGGSGSKSTSSNLPGLGFDQGPFKVNVFSESMGLVEVADGAGGAYEDLGVNTVNEIWGSPAPTQKRRQQQRRPLQENTAEQRNDSEIGNDDGTEERKISRRQPKAVGEVSQRVLPVR